MSGASSGLCTIGNNIFQICRAVSQVAVTLIDTVLLNMSACESGKVRRRTHWGDSSSVVLNASLLLNERDHRVAHPWDCVESGFHCRTAGGAGHARHLHRFMHLLFSACQESTSRSPGLLHPDKQMIHSASQSLHHLIEWHAGNLKCAELTCRVQDIGNSLCKTRLAK